MNRFARTLLALVLAAPAAQALDRDRDQPIELSADQAEMSNTTGVGVYTGDVTLTQGTLRITGDKMTVHTSAEGELERAVVEGRPATYRQLPEGEEQYVEARAPRMEYQARAPGLVVLSEGATLTQGTNRFTGETIRYRIDEDLVNAEGQGKERVNITFFPNKREQESESE